MIYQAHDGQSMFDIALQNYGDVSMVVKMLVDNPHLDSLNNSSLGGKSILINQNLITNTNFINYLFKKKTIFNTITPVFITGNYYTSNNNRVTEDGNERVTEDGQTIITE